jgi:RNA polymerase sigma-70 factor (ECF subfamily)
MAKLRVANHVGTVKALTPPIDAAPVAPGLDFEALVDAYYRPLYQFAMSLTRLEAEASDMTQQTFAIWAAKGHQLRDPSKVKTWLFTTLHREFLNTRRKQRRFHHDDLDEERDDLPFIEQTMEQQLDAKVVLDALARLSETYQAPLSLFYLGEHSYHEIAEILEIPIGTVQSRISRGKAQLQRALMERDSPVSDKKQDDCG